jgi:hypothetical protein
MNPNKSVSGVVSRFLKSKGRKVVIVTLDLEGASPEEYKTLDKAMKGWGLYKFTPTRKQFPLPANTYMGSFNGNIDATSIRDGLKRFLRERKELNVNGVFGGVLEDWAVI